MLRCSAEAFARCPTRHLCGRREDATYAEGSECDLFNRQLGERPVTNGEKLLSMSAEELVLMMSGTDMDSFNRQFCNEQFCELSGVCMTDDDCLPAIVKWLNAPAEVS